MKLHDLGLIVIAGLIMAWVAANGADNPDKPVEPKAPLPSEAAAS